MTPKNQTRTDVRVVPWDPRYKKDFIRLNEAWVTKFFEMEEIDRKLLYQCEETIVDPGGEVLFLLDGDRVVGTCALIAKGAGVFELAKMAVDEREQGRGLGNVLMEGTLQSARDRGAHKVFLLSNTRMQAAIGLYKKYGFKTIRLGPHPEYVRANIEMAIEFDG